MSNTSNTPLADARTLGSLTLAEKSVREKKRQVEAETRVEESCVCVCARVCARARVCACACVRVRVCMTHGNA